MSKSSDSLSLLSSDDDGSSMIGCFCLLERQVVVGAMALVCESRAMLVRCLLASQWGCVVDLDGRLLGVGVAGGGVWGGVSCPCMAAAVSEGVADLGGVTFSRGVAAPPQWQRGAWFHSGVW